MPKCAFGYILYLKIRTASKHSLTSLCYSNKRKTCGRYDLKIKIKIYNLKVIYEWILYRSFTKNMEL